MLLGEVCTRACRFCAVPTGNPGGIVDREEPVRLAEAIAELRLSSVVLTSVDRDDLTDGGASIFAAAIRETKRRLPPVKIEALIPDFSGNDSVLQTLIASNPDVIGHNIETVRRLSLGLRDPRAGYDQSLHVLERVREISPQTITKSSIMLGLGEEREEVLQTMRDLRSVGVRALTLGQYLPPSHAAAPLVATFIQMNSRNSRTKRGSLGSASSCPARWCAAPTTPHRRFPHAQADHRSSSGRSRPRPGAR